MYVGDFFVRFTCLNDCFITADFGFSGGLSGDVKYAYFIDKNCLALKL